MKTRIHFLDNFRTFLIFLVVLLHAGLVYEPVLENAWIVADPVKNNAIGLVRMYLDLFVMFCIFFISGYFMPVSLRQRNAWQVLKSKFRRIMVPWGVAVLTLIPAYKAIFLYSRGLPQEEWFSYFHFFERAGTDLTIFSNNPTQSWLWFLPVLFAFQITYLGLSKTGLFSLRISLKTGVMLTLITGILYSMVISLNGLTGWTHTILFDFQNERLLIYFLSFLLGTLCAGLKVFDVPRKKHYYILSNIILTITLGIFTAVALNLFFNLIDPERNYYFISPVADRLLYHTTALLSMLNVLYVMLCSFKKYFNHTTNALMNVWNRNSYAVYIIHVIVLGIGAMILLRMPVPALVKYFLLTAFTFIFSNLVIYVWQILLQEKINIKTATAAAVLFLTVGLAFAGKRTVITNQQTSAVRSQISLHTAVMKGDPEAVQQYIASGSDINAMEASGGSSPLIVAAMFGRTNIARILINAGADVNFRNKDGSTALHTAAFFCHTEIVSLLLENGADKAIINNAGSTALQSVEAPFKEVKGIYEYFENTLGPLGLELDYDKLQNTRPVVAEIISGFK